MPVTQIYQRNHDVKPGSPEAYTLQPFEYDVMLSLDDVLKIDERYIMSLAYGDACLDRVTYDKYFVNTGNGTCVLIRGIVTPVDAQSQIMVKFVSLKSLYDRIDAAQQEVDNLYGQVTRLEKIRAQYALPIADE